MTARGDAAARVGTPGGTAAPGRAAQGRATRRRRTLYRSALAAAALHGAALLLLLPRAPDPAPSEPPSPIEVELVQQDAQSAGAPAGAAAPVPPTPVPPTPVPPAPVPPAPEAPRPPDTAAATGPYAGAPAPPPAPSAPAVNLGDAAADRASLVVTGEGVVPPRPDASHRNQPPAYPPDAARRRRQGTVGLLIQVDEAGWPIEVRVVRGSGTPSLDRAARDAVLLWRFTPARIGGVPAAFNYPVEMHFKLGDR